MNYAEDKTQKKQIAEGNTKNHTENKTEAVGGKYRWKLKFKDGIEHEVFGTFGDVIIFCRELGKLPSRLDNVYH